MLTAGTCFRSNSRLRRCVLLSVFSINVLFIVLVSVKQRTTPFAISQIVYSRLVFNDSTDHGQDYASLVSAYHNLTVCSELPTEIPTYSLKPSPPTGQYQPVLPPGEYLHSVALTLAITTRGLRGDGALASMPFFKSLLPSFCRTASKHYDYHFFLAYDYDDPYMTRKQFLDDFGRLMIDEVKRSCPPNSGYTLHYIRCAYSQRVTWSQNDAVVEAYTAGMEYIYRINDDTEMTSPAWTETFISVLRNLDPPNVGICGPRHDRGNLNVLTYEFTHRTHVEIFGCYYPRILRNWDGDVWMTEVYRPDRAFRIEHITLSHTLEAGTRYKVTSLTGQQLDGFIQQSRRLLQRYISAKRREIIPFASKVIALSINITNPAHLWGAVRNAQLRNIYFPDWTVRVYVSCDVVVSDGPTSSCGSESYTSLTGRILRTLRSLGVDIRIIDPEIADQLPVDMWSYVAVDDPDISFVMVRHPESRPTLPESEMLSKWIRNDVPPHSNASFVVAGDVDDQDSAVCFLSRWNPDDPNVSGSWAARTRRLKSLVTTDVKSFLLTQARTHSTPASELRIDVFRRLVLSDYVDTGACCSRPDTVRNRSHIQPPHAGSELCPVVRRYDENEVGPEGLVEASAFNKQSLLYYVKYMFGV